MDSTGFDKKFQKNNMITIFFYNYIFSSEISCQNSVISAPSYFSEISEIYFCSLRSGLIIAMSISMIGNSGLQIHDSEKAVFLL